jgi:hypothetical protein
MQLGCRALEMHTEFWWDSILGSSFWIRHRENIHIPEVAYGKIPSLHPHDVQI